ncbi:porin [Ferrimonas sp. SCSIO 43195]|uniref:porin n=1 Tax=Ferrimonas sp. SCSIO 43195 TaxID=2822844 RepID=UPI0020764BE2|nr:porin [Ferrimonas sp. SCSIO 43195]USD38279.1 porin [Ferrimonas sp. SCSIO 43195]
MNLIKPSVVAVVIAAVLPMTAAAADPVTVYGKLNVSVDAFDVDGDSSTGVHSNASRLGVKGAFELSADLEAFYTIEYEVNTSADDKDNFEARNQFVGLRGAFGEVAVGRNDTMLKQSQGKVDLFGDLQGDIKNLFKGENRMEQTVTYLSPTFAGIKFGATYVAEESGSQKNDDDGFSVAAMYGDAKLKKSAIYASVAYDTDVKGFDSILRATVQGKIGDLKLGAMYQDQEEAGKDSMDGFMVSAGYQLSAVILKAQYQDMDTKGEAISAGVDYKLGKPTKLFAYYTQRDLESSSSADDYFGIGLEHKF